MKKKFTFKKEYILWIVLLFFIGIFTIMAGYALFKATNTQIEESKTPELTIINQNKDSTIIIIPTNNNAPSPIVHKKPKRNNKICDTVYIYSSGDSIAK